MRRVGIIGGGQLGLMLGNAGHALDVECVFLDPASRPPALQVGPVLNYAFDDLDGLRELAARCDLLTYEFENVPVDAVEAMSGETTIYPPAAALRNAQDRLNEKNLFRSLGIPTPDYHAVDTFDELSDAAARLGYPLILKTRRLGYDGKGQRTLHTASDLHDAWRSLGDAPLIAEQMIRFDYEVSIIGARRADGKRATYPLTENKHRDGILRTSRAPAGSAALNDLASRYLDALMDELGYVGVIALELFVVGDRLLANEFAPRVHNSGHWTIEGARTSQFENHLRAILGLPLGETAAIGQVAMENLIGKMPRDPAALKGAGYFVHDYGKEPRPDRKLGHITLVADDIETRERRLQELQKILYDR